MAAAVIARKVVEALGVREPVAFVAAGVGARSVAEQDRMAADYSTAAGCCIAAGTVFPETRAVQVRPFPAQTRSADRPVNQHRQRLDLGGSTAASGAPLEPVRRLLGSLGRNSA